MKILVTGGLGFIGSHTVVELLENHNEVVVIDNLFNSKLDVLDKIKEITGKEVKFYQEDVCDKEALEKIFSENDIDGVIHFAGYKAVGESCQKPLMYYHNNLMSTINLLEAMKAHDVKRFIFSSSATIYGDPGTPRYVEELGRGKTTNPYGTTKAMIEQILEDLYASDPTWTISILRYFNPIGAHSSGLIGENPNGIPNNLMPYIMKVAAGELEVLNVFGNDYPTPDGTGIRDYLHVVDLAKGHVAALQKVMQPETGVFIYNLGSGRGVSVLELVHTFEKVNEIQVNYKIVGRRAGDVDKLYCNPKKANTELKWVAKLDVNSMCESSYKFENKD